MKTRRALAGEGTVLAAIEKAAASHPWSLSQLINACRDERYEVWVVEDEAISGFAVTQRVLDEVTLLNIAVDPVCQGQGLGRQLLNAILENALASGAQRCLLEVRHSNEPARALYASLGFLVDGTREGYYPAEQGREDALLMSKSL